MIISLLAALLCRSSRGCLDEVLQGGQDNFGEVQAFTPACDALVVPNIDDALDEECAKREFWSSFRVLGTWWADLPPY